MSGGKVVGRLVIGVSAVALIVSLVGFIAAMGVDTKTEDYRAYGEIPVGAETTMYLPAGNVNISVHSQLTGVVEIDRVRIPDLQLTVDPPEGMTAPRLDSYDGGSTGGTGNFRKQLWIARIPADGDYVVRFDGDVGADGTIGQLVNPQLAFGKRSSAEDVMYWFLYLFAVSVVGLLIVPAVHFFRQRWWRDLDRAPGAKQTIPPSPAGSQFPAAAGTKDQRLKTLEALRDSGAITEREFTFEKRKLRKG
jgi:hypothetical protein